MLSLYLHFPFCLKKCLYCNFVSYPASQYDLSLYLEALLQEIRSSPYAIPLQTLYFGGGTPSLFTARQLNQVLQTLENRFGFEATPEITLEANPSTVNLKSLRTLRSIGFNRLSLGIQSFDDRSLKLLGRAHNAAQGIAAVKAARSAGFANISLDLLYALPYQTLNDWQAELNQAVKLEPSHISTKTYLMCQVLKFDTYLFL
jgi:oxygen-independent coproporphyrinogen-3 oxidase